MANRAKVQRLPKILLGRTDHQRLQRLADALYEKDATAADQLAEELDRAQVVEDAEVPAKTVRMGSLVTFALDAEPEQQVTLVFPGEADIAQGRLSILTPVGAALIGLSAGQHIVWPTRSGKDRDLRVIAVQSA